MNKEYLVFTYDDDDGFKENGPFSSEKIARNFANDFLKEKVDNDPDYAEDFVGYYARVVEHIVSLEITSVTTQKVSTQISEVPIR